MHQIIIVNFELLKRHSKSKSRAPVYPQGLPGVNMKRRFMWNRYSFSELPVVFLQPAVKLAPAGGVQLLSASMRITGPLYLSMPLTISPYRLNAHFPPNLLLFMAL